MELYALLTARPLMSLSPAMQNAAFEAAGIPSAKYIPLCADTPAQALRLCRTLGVRGANVTSPFKESILPFVHELDETSRAVGAVNTLVFRGDSGAKIAGFNTDPSGVAGALGDLGQKNLAGLPAAVLGTGGAARSAIFALTHMGARVSVIGRNREKAASLAHAFGASSFHGLSDIGTREALQNARVLVSCLSTKERVIPRSWISKDTLVLEANYGGEASAILSDARENGCLCSDGLSWLEHQGASSFQLWTGKNADTEAMHSALFCPGKFCVRPARGIALLGFSGAGKTTLARLLEKRLCLPALDTDSAVEASEHLKISEIFRRSGEAAFRELEAKALARLSAERCILSLGGGSLLNADNRRLVSRNRLCVWLAVSEKCAEKRLSQKGQDTRPLLAQSPSKSEQISALMARRREGYAAAADVAVDAEEPIEKAADDIARLWNALPEDQP